MSEFIKQLIAERKSNKLNDALFDGRPMKYLILKKTGKGPWPFPVSYTRQKNIARAAEFEQLLVIWIDDGGKVFYNWYNFIELELTHAREFFDSANDTDCYGVSRYFVKALDTDTFNGDQARALLDGTYYERHDKFSDLFYDGECLLKTYRDSFDQRRYRRIVHGIEWYFYLAVNDLPRAREVWAESRMTHKVKRVEAEGDRWVRVYCKNIKSTYKSDDRRLDDAFNLNDVLIQAGMTTYEGDLDPAKRWAIDNHVKIETELKLLYFDIETDDTDSKIVVGKDRILSIGAVDNEGNTFWKCGSDELELIEWFTTLARHYDTIVGYNSYNFDEPYIVERGKMDRDDTRKKIWWKPTARNWRMGHIDVMKRLIGTYGKLSDLKSFSLDNVSKHFLKKGKIEHTGMKIIDLFRKDRKKLEEYNMADCTLLRELDAVTGISTLMIRMCEWTGTFPTIFKPTRALSGISVSALLDMFVLRRAKELGIHYRSVFYRPEGEEQEQFLGALVLDPVKGMHEDVCVFDFRSLYPSIIWTWRISPENLKPRFGLRSARPTIKAPDDIKNVEFYKVGVAVFPMIVDELLVERAKYRKMKSDAKDESERARFDIMQQVAKELTNSLYGLLGNSNSRFYKAEVAGTVTAAGRYLIRKTKDVCESLGNRVVYGDTDSVFIEGLTNISPEHVRDAINTFFVETLRDEFGIEKSIIEIQYEKRMKRCIFIEKKHYAGWLTEIDGKPADKVLIKGLECIKRNTMARAKTLQEQLIGDLLKTDKGLPHYVDFVERARDDLLRGDVPVDSIVIRTQISKHPKDFKTDGPHVRVAKQMIADGKEFWIGMQVPYVIVNEAEKQYVHIDDFRGIFDRYTYWKKTYSVLERVLRAVFPEHDWTQYDPQEAGKREAQYNRAKAGLKGKKPAYWADVVKRSELLSREQKLSLLGKSSMVEDEPSADGLLVEQRLKMGLKAAGPKPTPAAATPEAAAALAQATAKPALVVKTTKASAAEPTSPKVEVLGHPEITKQLNEKTSAKSDSGEPGKPTWAAEVAASGSEPASDFIKAIDILDFESFAKAVHGWTASEVRVVRSGEGQYDLDDVSTVLARFMPNFSYIVTVFGIAQAKYQAAKDEWDNWLNVKYIEAKNKLAAAKATIKEIDGEVYASNKEEYEAKQGKLTSMRDKSNFLENQVRVWNVNAGILQSFNKNIVAELKGFERGLGG